MIRHLEISWMRLLMKSTAICIPHKGVRRCYKIDKALWMLCRRTSKPHTGKMLTHFSVNTRAGESGMEDDYDKCRNCIKIMESL